MQEQYSDLYIITQRRDAMIARTKDLVAKLWQHVRVERSGNKFTPYFDETVESIAVELEALNTKLETIETDTNNFKEILGEYRSLEEMSRSRSSAQRAIASADDTVRRVTAAAIKRGVPLADVEADPQVREAELSRDRIQTEFSGKVEDLAGRIEAAKKILEKYSSEDI